MLILISGSLVIAAILWSTLYAHYGPTGTLRTILSMVFIQFFGVGLVVSTALWYAPPPTADICHRPG